MSETNDSNVQIELEILNQAFISLTNENASTSELRLSLCVLMQTLVDQHNKHVKSSNQIQNVESPKAAMVFPSAFYDLFAKSLFDSSKYYQCFQTSHRAYQTRLMENIEDQDVIDSQLRLQSNCIPKLLGKFSDYNPQKTELLKNHLQFQLENNHSASTTQTPNVIITMTSCKRLNLFEKTVNSFVNCCLDLHRVKRWICVDDGSSETDKIRMSTKYPFIEFIWKTSQNKGHSKSCNLLRDIVINSDAEFAFHLEDDFEFILQDIFLTKCSVILQSSNEYGQCCINLNYGEAEEFCDIKGGVRKILSIDQKPWLAFWEHEFTGKSIYCEYWPHYSLRPGMIKTKVYKDLDIFNESPQVFFEMDFANKFAAKGYKTCFSHSLACVHIGRKTYDKKDVYQNAYDLNETCQFGKVGPNENVEPISDDACIDDVFIDEDDIKSSSPPQTRLGDLNDSKKIIGLKSHIQSSVLPTQITNPNDNAFGKVEVINLKRRPDRLLKMQSLLSKDKIDYTSIAAVDGSSLLYNQKIHKIFRNNDFNMRRGMVGCALTHLKLWKSLVDNDKRDYIVVLEDDITFSPNFVSKLNSIIQHRSKFEMDLIYIGTFFREFGKQRYCFEKSFDGGCVPQLISVNASDILQDSYGGTFGYIIWKSGAKTLLNTVYNIQIQNGIDWFMLKNPNLKSFISDQHLVFSESQQENINADSDIQSNMNTNLNLELSDQLMWSIYFWTNIINDHSDIDKTGTDSSDIHKNSKESSKFQKNIVMIDKENVDDVDKIDSIINSFELQNKLDNYAYKSSLADAKQINKKIILTNETHLPNSLVLSNIIIFVNRKAFFTRNVHTRVYTLYSIQKSLYIRIHIPKSFFNDWTNKQNEIIDHNIWFDNIDDHING